MGFSHPSERWGAITLHFVSYSSVDGAEFVGRLSEALVGGSPSVDLWIDKERLPLGRDWDREIALAIADCETFLFVMTPDSVEDESVCKREWIRALKCKRPIIPLLLDPSAELPFQLDGRQRLDVFGDFDEAVVRLRNYLVVELKSHKGQLMLLGDRLRDARRVLRRVGPADQPRVEQEIRELQAEIKELERVLRDEPAAEERVQARIEQGLARDRREGVGTARRQGAKVVNSPPAAPSDSFQDRRWETELLAEYLRNQAVRLVVISGPESIGKTAMVCWLLKRLLEGHPLPESGPVPLDGVVYLGAGGEHAASVGVLRDDLGRFLPADMAARVLELSRDPMATRPQRLLELLTALGPQRIIVFIDALDELANPDTMELRDPELAEALRFIQDVGLQHGVKVVVTSRYPLAGLTGAEADTLRRLPLDEGLPSPHAENVLRRLDEDGTVGLRDAPWEQLDQVRRLTNGNPMALEAVYAILKADRHTSLAELLEEVAALEPDKVVEDFLLREALSRLAALDRHVVEALAIYQCQVGQEAVEDLLRPYLGPFDAKPVLDRLIETDMVRRNGDLYQLPKRYWRHALARIPSRLRPDRKSGDHPAYTQATLLISAARHFEQAYKAEDARERIADLAAQLIEFDLWVRAGEHDIAAWVLLQIDFQYLLPWGHAREVLECHERLEGHLDDLELRQYSLGNTGSAHLQLGNHTQAIAYYERALDLATTPLERKWWVNNLGSALFNQGLTRAALDRYREALDLARTTGDRDEEATPLANIGLCYRDLGDYSRAMQHNQEALSIARTTGDLRLQAEQLEVAATLDAECGRLGPARRRLDEALALARGRGYLLLEANCLADRAELLLDEGLNHKAAEVAELALECNQQLGKVELARQGNYLAALAHLRTGAVEHARAAADQAAKYYPKRWWHPAAVLQGIVRLRDGDLEGALDSFARGISEAEEVVEEDGDRYTAHDAMGLGLLGLAVAGERWQTAAASTAFTAARDRTREPGVVGRVLRLIDDLAVADQDGVVDRVRAAARGSAQPSSVEPR